MENNTTILSLEYLLNGLFYLAFTLYFSGVAFFSSPLILISCLLLYLTNVVIVARMKAVDDGYENYFGKVFDEAIKMIMFGTGFVLFALLLVGADFSGFFGFVRFMSVIFCIRNLSKLFLNPDMTTSERIANIAPVVVIFIAFLSSFHAFDFLGVVLGVGHEIKIFSLCSYLSLLGLYECKDNKILHGTFDFYAWPKYMLGFVFGFFAFFIFLLENSAIINFFSVNVASYSLYALILLPLVINQTLVEEFIYRSLVLNTKNKIDPYNIVYFILAIIVTVIFTCVHLYQFEPTTMGLLLCFAVKMPQFFSYMLLTSLSDGVEYSSGVHLGWNLFISISLPFFLHSMINSATWFGIANAFCQYTAVSLLFLVPLLLVDRFFVLKVTRDNDGVTSKSFNNTASSIELTPGIRYEKGLNNESTPVQPLV